MSKTRTVSSVSFWGRNPQYATGGIPYMTADEKAALSASGATFTITSIRYNPHNKYRDQIQPRWECTVILPADMADDETARARTLTLGSNPARDAVMEAMQRYIEETDETIPSTLKRVVTRNGVEFYVLNPPADGADDDTDDVPF